jgi:hypothetical protein
MWRALYSLNHQHLILLQEEGWVGGCVDSGGESIEARRYSVHALVCVCLSASCGRKYDVNRDWGLFC